jgi:hypothetical protein
LAIDIALLGRFLLLRPSAREPKNFTNFNRSAGKIALLQALGRLFANVRESSRKPQLYREGRCGCDRFGWSSSSC